MEKFYHFLVGFNYETFGIVRSQILNYDPIPSLAKAYSMVTQEERQSDVAQGRETRTEAAAFFAGDGPRHITHKALLKCEHCGKTGHIKATC